MIAQSMWCVAPGLEVFPGSLRWEEGHIVSAQRLAPDVITSELLLTPGLLDLHVNGVHRFNFDQGAEALLEASGIFPRYGTTAVVATMQPVIKAAWLRTLEQVADAVPLAQGARVLGLHLEGPFLAVRGAATDPREGDLGLLEELLARCHGRLKIMSISPEVEGILPVIEALGAAGVIPFITHTRASVEETQRAIDAGARHATHFYDVFPVPEITDLGVRPAGAVETVLADPRATCDFICDGVHVHPMAIRAAVAAKGWEGVSLITDGNVGAGLPPGEYDTPWGYRVRVAAGDAPRIAEAEHPLAGALAGSALTMDAGINNLLRWLPLPPEQVWAMGTLNPARVLGEPNLGTLAPGAYADFVVWERNKDQWRVAQTYVAGKLMYDSAI